MGRANFCMRQFVGGNVWVIYNSCIEFIQCQEYQEFSFLKGSFSKIGEKFQLYEFWKHCHWQEKIVEWTNQRVKWPATKFHIFSRDIGGNQLK